jgi:nitrogen fixation NifU-like protein|tara:strand:+ start:441 stop:836 length:396 start_codon:yes stop_codon:yes gene_type:complete
MISSEIIKIASDTSNYGIKRKSNYVATSKNRICGDRITVEVEISNNIIKKMYYETESCVFCEAAASLLSKIVRKNTINEFLFFADSVKKKKIILSKKYLPFKKLFHFKYKERINCVMLPFDALRKAVFTTK